MLFTVLFTFIIRLWVATMTIVSSSQGDGSGRESHGRCGGDLVMPRSILARTSLEPYVCVCVRHGGSYRRLGAVFFGLPALLRCILCPDGFTCLGALVDCGSPLTPVLSCALSSQQSGPIVDASSEGLNCP